MIKNVFVRRTVIVVVGPIAMVAAFVLGLWRGLRAIPWGWVLDIVQREVGHFAADIAAGWSRDPVSAMRKRRARRMSADRATCWRADMVAQLKERGDWPRDITCDTCRDRGTCPSAYDLYNTGGDCLESK